MFENPKLKPQCRIKRELNGVRLDLARQSILLEIDEPENLDDIFTFIGSLDGSRKLSEVRSAVPTMSDDNISSVLKLLDESYLLTEGLNVPLLGPSGLQLIVDLEGRYQHDWLISNGQSKFADLLHRGLATPDVVIGWTFEYYHVTRRAHDCIAPAIANSQGSVHKRLIKYFREEYRHDKLLAKSLRALGHSQEAIEFSVPLSYTAALMNLLGKWARTDLLSFFAALFVFEGTEAESARYVKSLENYKLPAGFLDGQVAHHDINVEEEHGNVSRELFSMVEYVQPADTERIAGNLRSLSLLMQKLLDQVLSYYGNPIYGIPRSLDLMIK